MVRQHFKIGDPVKPVSGRGRLGTVIGHIGPIYDELGVETRQAQVIVQPPLRKYTSVFYREKDLILCRCAVRTPRNFQRCEQNVPL